MTKKAIAIISTQEELLCLMSQFDIRTIYPLSTEADYFANKYGFETVQRSELFKTRTYYETLREIKDRVKSSIESSDNEWISYNTYCVSLLCRNIILSDCIAELLTHNYDTFYIPKYNNVVFKEASGIVSHGTNFSLQVINLYLIKNGYAVIPITVLLKDSSEQKKLYKNIINEFPPNSWYGLLKGFFSMFAGSIFKNISKNILITSGGEYHNAIKDVQKNTDDYFVIFSSIWQAINLNPELNRKHLPHVMFLRFIQGSRPHLDKSNLYNSLIDEIQRITSIDIFNRYQSILEPVIEDLITAYLKRYQRIIYPLMKWMQRIQPDKVILVNPLFSISREIAYWCRRNDIKTICLQHSSEYRIKFPKTYECYDSIVIRNELLKMNIEASGYKGDINFVNHDSSIEQKEEPIETIDNAFLFISFLTEAHNFDYQHMDLDVYRRVLDWMSAVCDDLNVKVYVKKHPRYDYFDILDDITTSKNFIFINNFENLDIICQKFRMAVTLPSETSALEVFLRNRVPIVVLDPSQKKQVVQQETPFDYYTYIDKYDDFYALIKSVILDKQDAKIYSAPNSMAK